MLLDSIGELNEESYRKTLWDHRPITDFWRNRAGSAERLNRYGIRTMREITLADENLTASSSELTQNF